MAKITAIKSVMFVPNIDTRVTVSGRLLDDSGNPIPNGRMEAYINTGTQDLGTGGLAYTGSDGSFSITCKLWNFGAGWYENPNILVSVIVLVYRTGEGGSILTSRNVAVISGMSQPPVTNISSQTFISDYTGDYIDCELAVVCDQASFYESILDIYTTISNQVRTVNGSLVSANFYKSNKSYRTAVSSDYHYIATWVLGRARTWNFYQIKFRIGVPTVTQIAVVHIPWVIGIAILAVATILVARFAIIPMLENISDVIHGRPPIPPKEEFKCPYSDYTATTAAELDQHLESVHGQKKFTCPYDGIIYNTEADYKRYCLDKYEQKGIDWNLLLWSIIGVAAIGLGTVVVKRLKKHE